MQERVTAQEETFFDVIVQFSPDLNLLGLGLEPRNEGGQHHFLDTLYGEKLQTIGEIFHGKMTDLGLTFIDADPTATVSEETYKYIGRAVLDSVGGSSATFGLWTWLTRPGTNRLIRLLRKGRDVSFGRDE